MLRMLKKDEMIIIENINQLKELIVCIGHDGMSKVRFIKPGMVMIPRVSELLRNNDLAIVYNNGCYGFGSASTHKEKGKKVVTIKQLEVNEKNKELLKKMYEQLQGYNKDKEKERSDIFMNELFRKVIGGKK